MIKRFYKTITVLRAARILALLIAVMLMAASLVACGADKTGLAPDTAQQSEEESLALIEPEEGSGPEAAGSEAAAEAAADEAEAAGPAEIPEPASDPEAGTTFHEEGPPPDESASDSGGNTGPEGKPEAVGLTVEKDGTYTSKEEVALYIHTYGRLPSNFISKTKARKSGWDASEGNLDEILPGMSIGGGPFNNYDGQLPEGNYRECDINYTGGFRGPERLVYSDDGRIYYTPDHYQTFEQLY